MREHKNIFRWTISLASAATLGLILIDKLGALYDEASKRYDARYVADVNRNLKVEGDEVMNVYKEIDCIYIKGDTLESLSFEDVKKYLSNHPRAK